MPPKELKIERALKKFLDANPWLQGELSELNYPLAERCGLTTENYKRKHLKEAFEAQADAHACDVWDFTLQWIAETPEELEVMREARLQEMYRFLDGEAD